MIQRVQTIYLIGSIVLFVLMLCFPLGYFTLGTNISSFDFRGVQIGPDFHHALAISVILFIAVICEILAVFLYRNRSLQMRLVTFNSLLQIAFYLALVSYIFLYKGEFKVSYCINWTVFLPLVTIILNILAYKAIRKDESLVRSLNHLR